MFAQLWTFRDLVVGSKNVIEDWLKKEPIAVTLQMGTLLKDCSKVLQHSHWGHFKHLKGGPRSEKIWEIGFTSEKRQYRLFGIFTGKSKEAILLLGCYHKERKYTPTDAFEIAMYRARLWREGKAGTHERPIDHTI